MPLDLVVSIREKRRIVHARSERNCVSRRMLARMRRVRMCAYIHRRGGWLIYETCIDRTGQFAFAGVQENRGFLLPKEDSTGCRLPKGRKREERERKTQEDRGGSTVDVVRRIREAHLYKRADDFSSR